MSESKSILVIGGGISGMTAALEAAETGKSVVIVEKSPYIGGRVARINQYFPKFCPPVCGMEINLKRIKTNPNIKIYTLAEVDSISGSAGNYDVSVTVNPRYVNSKCTLCGKCADACTSEIDDDFNLGMCKTKAAYLPHKMAYPRLYVLDPGIIGTDEAQKCKDACKYDAIDLDMKPEKVSINAGAVIVATGWKPFDASKVEYYNFDKNENIITNVMMERLNAEDGPTHGKILRPSDGKEPTKVAFVQCAGSRDENYQGYCSGVCCAATIKQVNYVRNQYPDAEITVFYIDIRTPGRLEDLYLKIQEDEKVTFQKGKAVNIDGTSNGNLLIEAEDTLSGVKSKTEADLVVLATGMVPNLAETGLPGGGASFDEYGFVVPNGEGIYGAGVAKRPVDVATCTQDSTGAALKAIQCLVRG